MTRKNLKLEKEVSVVKVELEASKEKAEALNRVRLDLVSKLSESTEGLASAQAALIEAKARGEAIRDVEEEQQTLRDEVSTLRAQLEEARVATARQKIEADQRLHQVRQEVEHYREQLAGSESRLESLGETTTSVVKPLLQQIQSLQSKLNDQTKAFEDTEHSLLSQITDFKKRLESAERTDRQFQDRINEAETAADALRRELTLERENSSRLHDRISQYNIQASADKIQMERLHSELDSLHQKITALEDSRDSANSALTAEREELMNLRAELNKTKSELAHALSSSSLLTTTVAATSYSPTSSEIQPLRPSTVSSSSHILAETLTEQSSPSSPTVSRSSVTPTGHFASIPHHNPDDSIAFQRSTRSSVSLSITFSLFLSVCRRVSSSLAQLPSIGVFSDCLSDADGVGDCDAPNFPDPATVFGVMAIKKKKVVVELQILCLLPPGLVQCSYWS
ncbi:hypothetical protein ACTXT7_003925 [Hymenolepis weldensis]